MEGLDHKTMLKVSDAQKTMILLTQSSTKSANILTWLAKYNPSTFSTIFTLLNLVPVYLNRKINP